MYIDLHCDTVIKNIGRDRTRDMYENDYGHLDLKSLIDAGVKGQYFAIYLFDEDYEDRPVLEVTSDLDYCYQALDYLDRMVEKYSDKMARASNYLDYEKNRLENKLSIFYSIENGRVIDSIDRLVELKSRGISLVTLLWNHETHIGYPHSRDPELMGKGLKKFGRELVEAMNELKMIVDVSHLSDGGFWDVEKISKAPFIASHSNSRALSPHSRNLTDPMIKALANKGGLMGLNLFSKFLAEDIESNVSKKSDLLRHIKHIVNVGGEDILAIGTDFDGIDGYLEVGSPQDLNKFLNSLTDLGIAERLVEKIAYKNFEDFYRNFYK